MIREFGSTSSGQLVDAYQGGDQPPPDSDHLPNAAIAAKRINGWT
jgi:hypothetical protein